MTLPIYSALLGAALLVVQNLLMLTVGIYRTRTGKSAGVDGDIKLERLARRHGNLAENAAIFVAVLTLYELLAGQTAFALWIALLFAFARLLHIAGFSDQAGSHLVGAEGSKKIFVMMRGGGAGLSAVASLLLGINLALAAMAVF
ncbi:MAPEG family protein [Hoeflea prorocentri]|uniref:MAPEG family protein n=1 Tax=Hoeflea prorocentri TaxID=1922333 RepID=A0A9X3UM51_9HYPH|nr:MAPEG family protein [Hoeflea prorocentri]MCY6383273.1 MAPEG family protein [Hoeflea prorocentri]MDA5401073.1 MAPEG family protein [Hoeflea prorocentri]